MVPQWKSPSPSPWTKTPLRSTAKRGGIVHSAKEACPQLRICLWLTRAEGRTLHLCMDHRHHVDRECTYTPHPHCRLQSSDSPLQQATTPTMHTSCFLETCFLTAPSLLSTMLSTLLSTSLHSTVLTPSQCTPTTFILCSSVLCIYIYYITKSELNGG